MKNQSLKSSKLLNTSLCIFCFAFFLFLSNQVAAQNVGVNTTSPNASAMLDVVSTKAGILVPRLTMVQRNAIALPATSLLIYQTDNTPGYYYNSGTPASPVWIRFAVGSELNFVSGTGAATRVAFWTGTNTLAANANLYWDNVNGRLGIGTASPSAQLHTTGTVRFANYPSGTDGAILRTNSTGVLSTTNFTGNASHVLLGNGTFGAVTTSETAWQLTGNSILATNFIGTTNAQDMIFKTNSIERMRVISTGTVLVNAITALDATDALEVVVSPTFTTGLGAYGNGGYPIWGQQLSGADDAITGVNSAASGAGIGCGIVGISEQTGGAGIWGDGKTATRGVLGITDAATRSAIQAQNSNSNGDAIYAVNSAVNGAGTGSAIYASSNQTGGQTIAATLQNMFSYPNSCISAIASSAGSNGIVAESESNTGTGVRGRNDAANGTAIGFGGFFTSNQTGAAALASCLRGNSYYANSAISGNTASTVADGNGIFGGCDNATGVGVKGQSLGSNGIGVLGLTNQEDGFAVYGLNLHTLGTGVVGAGNGVGAYTLTSGSGGAFTGTEIGVYGYATTDADGSFGGYFNSGMPNSWAYVGGRNGTTNYKINGPGSVATVVERQDGTTANMFCPEAPEILFQDYGSGKLVNGKAIITLDPTYSKNIYVDEVHPLRVFIQLEGNCNGVYVTNKTANGFEVIELQNGNSNVEFSWTVTAVRSDSKDENGNITSKHIGVRFPDAPLPMETASIQKAEIQKAQILDETSSQKKEIDKSNQILKPKKIKREIKL